jgi:HlyD family secretion protein
VIRAPAAGQVRTVHRTSEGPVNPGEPLLEIGNTRTIEVRVDVLSEDAVQIEPGTRVRIHDWGGETVLDAVVTRVEPEAITKISALGVEEQRVPVRASITSPDKLWGGLGSGYRVVAQFIVWENANVLQVPTAALFRTDDGWATFVVDNGRARLRRVEIGQQGGLATQVLEGLADGEVVVVHPPNELEDGARVATRE